MVKLFNTLSRQIEEFVPLDPPHVGMYTCGPTVYDYAHIGHARKYTGDDILRRVLVANGYEVKHVMNITDVGHLVSDADEGEDKLEKGAKERDMSVWDVAKFFEADFWKGMDALNILRPNIVAHATKHINEQIKLIQKLEEKGYIYVTDEAVYFDVAKFPEYTKLNRQKLEEKSVGSRADVIVDSQKKHPADFALWFFTVGHFANHSMHWPSPWGEGFPGWHIECSAMSMEYLGNTLDIHTGGIDHISVHHTNEIAQSEAATGDVFVRFWVHHNFLQVNGEKMSKSKKNYFRIEDISERGFDPIVLRYLFLTAHYRDELNFTWESLQAAQNALSKLREEARGWKTTEEGSKGLVEQSQTIDAQYWQKFFEAANNDLNTSQALAVMWDMVKSDISTPSKAATILKMDEILGLGLREFVGKPLQLSKDVQELVEAREKAREKKDYKRSDELRHEINKLGYDIKDTESGPQVVKKS